MKVLKSLFKKQWCEKLKEKECFLPGSQQSSVWECRNFFITVKDYSK